MKKLLVIVLFFVVLVSFTNYAYGITVGFVPIQIAINPITDRAYVSHADGFVHVIDTTTNTPAIPPIISVSPGNALTGITVDLLTNKIYVANSGTNQVAVIDGDTNTVIATIDLAPAGVFPVDVEVNTVTNTLYVSNVLSLVVIVIDLNSNTIIDKIPGFDSPARFAFDPSTNRMYMTNFVTNQVSVLDGTKSFLGSFGADSPFILSIPIGNGPDGIEINTASNKIYTANSGSDTVSVIDTTTNTVLTTIQVGVNPVDVGVDSANNRIYVSNKNEGTVSVINGTTDTLIKTIPADISSLTPRLRGLAVHNDTGDVYAIDSGIGIAPGTVTVINFTANNPPVAKAGLDQVVGEGVTVILDGVASSDPDGDGLSFAWNKTFGPSVSLTGSSSTSTSFTAPQVDADTLFTFKLIVNSTIFSSIPDFVNVVVKDETTFTVPTTLTGGVLSGNQTVGEIFAGSTYALQIDGALPSAELQQLVIPTGINDDGFIFNFTGSPQVVSGIVEPDLETALFLDLTFDGVDFALPENFESEPKIQFLVDSGFTSAQSFADGCAVMEIQLLNETSGQFEQIGDPLQANTNKIYVTNVGLGITPGTLSVIDGSTNNVIDTITIGFAPKLVGFDQNANRIYVANQGTNTVSVIDGSTNSVIATIPVGLAPVQPVVNPNTSNVYVTNQGAGTVSVIDGLVGSPTENTVIATIPTGVTPVGVDVDTDLNKIYVTNTFGSSVTVIDGSDNTVIIPPLPMAQPSGIVVDSGNNRAYVSNFDDRAVTVIDTNTDSIIAVIPVGPGPAGLSFNPSTSRLYVANQLSGTVSVIDTEINAAVATITTGSGVFDVAANPNTNRAYVSNRGIGTVSVIDGMPGSPTENTVIDTIAGFSNNFGIALNPAVPNPVRDPSSDVAGQCAYIAQPPHFSKFAIGGVALALGGVGGGGGGSGGSAPIISLDQLITSTVIELPSEVEQMVFSHDSSTPISPMALGFFENFDYPLIINDKGFVLSGFSTTLETQTLQTNTPVTIIFTVYEAEKIQHFSLYTNLRDANSAIHQSDTQILFNDGQEIQIVDPNGFFEDVSFTLNEIDDLKKQIVLEITFAKAMDTSHIITRIWDPNLFSRDTHILDVIKIVSDIEDESSITTYEEPLIEELQSQSIPKWIKNNAAWWSDQQISDSDFVSGIEYLIKNGIINVPGVEISTDSTSTEIPDWIQNNAGWWADGQITDDDFVKGIQYLVEQGIIRV